MGWMADMAYEYMLEAELRQEQFINTLFSRYNKKEKIWKTKNGRKLSIQEMSDSHLNNSYKITSKKKSSDYKDVILKILKTEISRRNNGYYKTIKYCPNCNAPDFNGDCKECSFDATEGGRCTLLNTDKKKK